MAPYTHIPCLIFSLLLWYKTAFAKNPAFLEQGYFFDYNILNQPVPIPTTVQCDTIHIKWSRSTATGPNPTAPYYLEIFTSTFIVPFKITAGSGLSFDWQVPFAPGTQYQICMFDRNGVTGGCQGIYTVIPAANSSGLPSCQNVTFPVGALDVVGAVDNGPLSQYGWIDQCTDLSVTPRNGTPPFTLTVAPTLHPPVNITSNSMDAINWTVTLSWASPFFISLTDSAGNGWANGPLHSGGQGPTSCLSLDTNGPNISVAALVGTGVGAFVLGTMLALLAACVFVRFRNREGYDEVAMLHHKTSLGSVMSPTSAFESVHDPSITPPDSLSTRFQGVSTSSHASGPLMGGLRDDIRYHVEPFVLPNDNPANIHTTSLQPPNNANEDEVSHTLFTPQSSNSDSSRQANTTPQVYVVHHDGGQPPVTVFMPEGTEVVELPPRYADDRRQSPIQQRRLRGSAGKPRLPS